MADRVRAVSNKTVRDLTEARAKVIHPYALLIRKKQKTHALLECLNLVKHIKRILHTLYSVH